MDSPHDSVDRLIFQRRSIRRYKSKALPEEWVRGMLACAHQAPSPSNSQPVRFVRIRSQQCREKLHRALEAGHDHLLVQHRSAGAPARLRNWINAYRRYSEFMFTAPVLLAVGLDTQVEGFSLKLRQAGLKLPEGHPNSERDITLGMALKGLVLKAQSLGVGSCILTAPLLFIQGIEDLLGLAHMTVKCFVTLGLADETPKASERQPLDAVIKVV